MRNLAESSTLIERLSELHDWTEQTIMLEALRTAVCQFDYAALAASVDTDTTAHNTPACTIAIILATSIICLVHMVTKTVGNIVHTLTPLMTLISLMAGTPLKLLA